MVLNELSGLGSNCGKVDGCLLEKVNHCAFSISGIIFLCICFVVGSKIYVQISICSTAGRFELDFRYCN